MPDTRTGSRDRAVPFTSVNFDDGFWAPRQRAVRETTIPLLYGQFVYALTFLTRQELQPATVGIYSFVGGEYADWHRVMAFSSVFVLPIIALFVLLQRRIVAGLTAGALK